MSMMAKPHDLIELPLPDEVKEAIEEILKEREAKEEITRMGVLGLMRRSGGGIKVREVASKEDYDDAVNEPKNSGVEGPGDISYYNAASINGQILESWRKKGMKVKIHCYGSLMIESDVDAKLFTSVVDSIECWSDLQIPIEIYKEVSQKFKQIDTVHTYERTSIAI
jgi:hypothetical protein